MEKKVVYEVRLSKPVMTVAIMAAVGLLAIGAKPLIEATPAFAANQFDVQKIAICDWAGQTCIVPVSKPDKIMTLPVTTRPWDNAHPVVTYKPGDPFP